MKITILGFALANLLLMNARAGTVGNGGDVLVCGQGATKTYQMLDAYEALEISKWVYSYPFANTTNKTWQDKVTDIIESRIRPHLPSRADKYTLWFKQFMSETQMVDGTKYKLNDIPDSLHLFIPVDCELKQIAIQRDPQWGGSRYTIDETLWSAMDEDQKAVLIMHEIIYREAIEEGQENSIPTRYFNSFLFSKILSATDEEIYSTVLKVFSKSGDLRTDYKGLPFGKSYPKEKLLVLIDQTGSNGHTDQNKTQRLGVVQALLSRYRGLPRQQKWISNAPESKPSFPDSGWLTDDAIFEGSLKHQLQSNADAGGNGFATSMELVSRVETEVQALAENERLHIVWMVDEGMDDQYAAVVERARGIKAVQFHFVYYATVPDQTSELMIRKTAAEFSGKAYAGQEIFQIDLD
jgi:hypothetical protein